MHWRSNHFKNQRSGVIFAVRLYGLAHKALCDVGRGILRRIADKPLHPAIPKTLDQAVRATQESVTRLVANATDQWAYLLILAAEHLLQPVASWVVASLCLTQFTLTLLPAYMRVVVAKLLDTSRRWLVIDTAIANMSEVDPSWANPT